MPASFFNFFGRVKKIIGRYCTTCLVPRPQYFAAVGSHGPGRSSSAIRHRNQLTWEKAFNEVGNCKMALAPRLVTNMVTECFPFSLLCEFNTQFYSCLLSDPAFEWLLEVTLL